MDFDDDKKMAQTLLERLGGALTTDDILLLRAAGVWHYSIRMLSIAAEWDDDADPLTVEQQRALDIVGMLPPDEPDGTINLVTSAVRDQLNRAEVAVGYLFARHGVPIEDRPPSYPSIGFEPALGPSDVMEVWDKIATADPSLELSDDERAWTNASLDKDDEQESKAGETLVVKVRHLPDTPVLPQPLVEAAWRYQNEPTRVRCRAPRSAAQRQHVITKGGEPLYRLLTTTCSRLATPGPAAGAEAEKGEGDGPANVEE